MQQNLSDLPTATLSHCAICVSDLNRSVDFYQNLFAMEKVGEWSRPDDGLTAVLLLGAGGARLEIVEKANVEQQDSSELFSSFGFTQTGLRHLAFTVPSVDQSFERALQLGAKPLMPPRTGKIVARLAFVLDLDGIQLEFTQLSTSKSQID